MDGIEIRIIDYKRKEDINIPNEPFTVYGRMIPAYDGQQWSYTTELFEEKKEECFPDENYQFEEMSDCVFIGAYAGDQCVGLAIMRHHWSHFMYLHDLKVNSAFRGKKIGARLIQKSMEIARENGYCGIYTIGQDDNLAACLFYLKNGFHIGGFDCDIYRGTSQEHKKDIKFYTDCNKK